MPRPRWAVRTVQVLAVCVALATALALFIHAPPIRRAVLRRTVALLSERFNLTLRADALDYNLLALRVAISGLELAAPHSPEAPFLTADRVEIEVPTSALFGAFALDRVAVENARVSIVRGADSRWNLPEGGDDDGEPSALPIGRIQIPQLAIDVTDRQQDFSVALPAIAVDVGPSDGAVRLTQPGRVSVGRTALSLSALGGGVTFDGRAVALNGFVATTPEATLRIDGGMSLLVEEPRVDARFAGSGAVERILRLLPDPPSASGALMVTGTIAGPLAQPRADVNARSDELRWEQLVLADVDASLQATGDRLHISRFAGRLAGGRVTASGDVVPTNGSTDLMVAWSDLDVDALLRVFAVRGVRPSATANGTASLRGSGSDLRAWTIDARSELRPRPRARGQIAVDGDASLRVADGRWAVDIDGTVERVPVRGMVGGRIDPRVLTASTIAGRVTAADVDIPAALDSLRSAGVLQVDPNLLTAGRADAEVVLAGTIGSPHMQITAMGRELAAGGISGLTVDLTLTGTTRALALQARVRQGNGNQIIASGTVSPDTARTDLRIAGELGDWAALQPDLQLQGTAAVDLQVERAADAMTARGTVRIPDAAYAGVRVGALIASIRANADAVDADLSAPELNTRSTVRLSLTGERRAAIDIRIDDADLARLTRDAGTPVAITGRVDLTARGEAPLDNWRRGTADVELSRLDARVGDLPVRLASPARVSYSDETIDVKSLEAELGDTRLSVAGRLPAGASPIGVAPAEALRALLVGDIEHLVTAVQALGVTGVPDVDARGPIALLARVTGTAERPTFAADLDVGAAEIVVGKLPPVRIDEVRATVANGWIERLTARGSWQESRVRLDGRAPLSLFREHLPGAVLDALPAASGAATLDVRAESITPALLRPFVDPESVAQLEGVVDASARLEADTLDLADVRGEVRLDRLDVRVAGLPVTQREPTRVAIDDGVARVVSWDWTGQGATLNVQGEIGLTTQQAAILGSGVVDLRLLAPFVRTAGLAVAGTIVPRFSVSGSLANPRLDGEAVVTDAEIRLAEPRVVATDVDAFAILSPEQARITTLTGVVNGGALMGTGEARYGRGVTPSLRIAGTITGMGLEFPAGLRSELNADLAVSLMQDGEQTSGAVTGTVTVVRSAYREPLAVAGALLTALRSERAAVAQADPDALASRLALDVRVVTDSDIVVDNNLARLQLGGDLRLIGTAAAPALAGRAEIREGGQLFLGPTVYTLDERGTIDFADPTAIVPELNVQATTRVAGHRIDLVLTGTLEDLDAPQLSAPESSLSQADIASLLLTGRVLNDVAGAEADILREQVVGFLSGDVLGLASRAVGLDTIRLGGPDTSTLRRDPGAVAGEVDPTSRLTFGKLIREDVELTYSQSLREADAQTWIVDYRPLSQLNLRVVSNDENLRAYEFRHEVAIGGSGADPRRQAERATVDEVTDVTLDADETLSASLSRVLRLAKGDTFDFVGWQSDRDRLEESLHRQGYLEARVTAQRLDRDGGVALVYDVVAGPITRISVSGYSLPERTTDAIAQAWTQAIFDDFLREEAEGLVRTALADDGYLDPRITTMLEEVPLKPDSTSTPAVGSGFSRTKTLRIAIDPGVRIRERRIAVTVSGNDALQRELDALVEERNLAASAWNAREGLQAALAGELRGRGYLAAQVRTEPPRIEGDVAILPVSVDPGPLFVIGAVTFSGATRISSDRLTAQAALTAGTPYIPNELEEGRRRIDSLYRSEGFVGTRVTAEPKVDRTGQRVDVVFTVVEGPQQVLREIAVSGNRGIDDGVIRRAVAIKAGEPVGADAWLRARARLFETGLFRRVDVTAEPFETSPDGRERGTRLNVVVEEWPALRLRYGIQVSEERPEDSIEGRDLTPGLSAEVTRRTLFGRAIGVGAAAEYQRRERLARIFLNAPTLFGWPVESLLTLERSHRDFAAATFVTDASSVAWEQRVGVGRRVQLSYAYRFDRDHTFETGVPSNPLFPVFDVTVNIARLTGWAVFDTRDDPTNTTRGWLLSGNVELSPQALGSDVSFVRQVGQAYHFRPWGRVVFASAARLGVVTPRGGQEVLPSELFFAGGARTLRGVSDETLGPRNIFDEPAGGEALLALNQEVRFPLFKWFNGVGFFDAANVFPEPRDIRFGRLVTAVGAGLRVNTPFGVLRTDYGRPWTNRGGLRSSEWTFGIGHTF